MCLIFLWDFVYYVFGMGVYQKNKKWYYEFQMFGVRKHGACRGCNDISSALEYEADVKEQLSLLHRNKIGEENIITIGEMFDLFLKFSKVNNKEQMYIENERRVKFFKNLWGAKNPITNITPTKIEELKAYLIFDKGLTRATFNRYLATISRAFNIIIINKKLNMNNPCIFVKKLKEDNHILRYLTKDEEERLMANLSEHLKPIVICALQTGLRRSNILNLKWEQINFEQGFIEVLKQDNKGHKKIQIPLSQKLKSTFEKIGIKKRGYVFINPENNQPYKSIKTGFNRALQRAGIENFRFHDLRHTVGTRLVASGVDLLTVKEILAHSKLATTQRYTHPTPENMKKAVAILENF